MSSTRTIVSGHRSSKGVYLATGEVKPTMPPSQCGRQSSWLTSSPDHLVCLKEDGWGHGEADGLGSLEVDDQRELGGLLHGHVGRLGAFEDLIHIGRSTVIPVGNERVIDHETPSVHIFPVRVHPWEPVPLRQVHYPREVVGKQSVRHHNECLGTAPGGGGKGALELVGGAHLQDVQLHP